MKRLCVTFGLLLFVFSLAPVGTNPLLGQADVSQETAEEPQGPRALSLDDYGSWSRIAQVALSSDGRWMTFSYAPNDGESRLFLRDLYALWSTGGSSAGTTYPGIFRLIPYFYLDQDYVLPFLPGEQ